LTRGVLVFGRRRPEDAAHSVLRRVLAERNTGLEEDWAVQIKFRSSRPDGGKDRRHDALWDGLRDGARLDRTPFKRPRSEEYGGTVNQYAARCTFLPKDLIMLAKKYLPHLMFTALCAVGSFAHAAEEPSVKLDRPGYGVKELKEGDNAPDQYQRPDLALKDWRARHLSEPGDDKQWVEIHDQYALIDIPTGTIRKMVPKAKAHK
jgi:Ni/Co efflux regulator RcnB